MPEVLVRGCFSLVAFAEELGESVLLEGGAFPLQFLRTASLFL